MTQVVIGDILPRTQASATGGQTVFGTNWTANYESDVVVYLTPAGDAPDDFTQQLSYPSQYSVAFIGDQEEVQVTLVTPASLGDIVTIVRDTPADRQNLYSNTNFTPSMLNNDFGILTLVDQQAQLVNQLIGPRYNYSAEIVDVVDTIMPLLEANESWRKNSDGTAIEAFIPLSGSDVTDVKFIIQQPNALVPDAQALSDLATGIVKNTTATGVLSISAPLSSLDSIGISTDQMAYGSSANTYSLATLTPYSRSLFAETDAASWRSALGVGPSGAFFAIANNLSEGVPATMRTNLGLVIGTNVQAYDATLQSISALGTTSDKTIYTTGIDTWAETALTSFGRSLIASADAAAAASTLSVLPLSGGTLTGALFLFADPTMGSEAVTKNYVDNLVQNTQIACLCMTEQDQLSTWTYNNGVAGVGATLTAPGNGATTFDGIVPANTNRVFVNLQTGNEEWQGPYTIVQGTVGTPTVLTRATDYDQASEMQAGDIFSVVQGTTWGASQWMMSQVNAITVGTTDITFQQLEGQGALLKANNLSDLTNAATARSNLGLVIGTNVQAYDATLQSISALGTAANKMIYTSGVDTWAETDATSFGRTFLGLSPSNGGIIYSTAASAAVLAGTATAGQMLRSGSTAAPTWSTAAFPNVATSTGSFIYADGTNFIQSTSLWPNTVGASGKVVISNGTTNVYSTPTFPNSSATTGKVIISDGTNWIASTPTYPSAAGTSGNVLTSDGTNWVSSAATGTGTVNSGTTNQLAYYAANGTAVSGLATANNGYLKTDGSGVPSIAALSSLGIDASLVKTVKVQAFTGSGTYTPSTGMLYCIIECLGGGGGGAGATTTSGVGVGYGTGGGGAGAYSMKVSTAATVGASQSVTIGAAGTGTSGNSAGGNGGATSVGSICTANGGSGGAASSGSNAPGLGGSGGTAGTGDLAVPGENGCIGSGANGVANIYITSGKGADSHYGQGGKSAYVGGGANSGGNAAGGYGAGGSGGASLNVSGSVSGGAGTAGYVIITEFCNQ
jgi:hypothetical protein